MFSADAHHLSEASSPRGGQIVGWGCSGRPPQRPIKGVVKGQTEGSAVHDLQTLYRQCPRTERARPGLHKQMVYGRPGT
ncbi:hypothetical protein J6590_033944 [Homalodisca vitripennis]|nr:hypothetical protein J6590_033944 [Homalodisca vitripennis]